jgi:hypothetical protein
MNKSIIAILLLASATAFANEAADEQANRWQSSGAMTRAEVRADIAHAKAAGTLRLDEYAANKQKAGAFERTRTEVRAEAVLAARAHAVHEQY